MNVLRRRLLRVIFSQQPLTLWVSNLWKWPPVFTSQPRRLPCYSAVKQAYEFHEGKVVEQRLKTVQVWNVQMENNSNPSGINRLKVWNIIGLAWPLWQRQAITGDATVRESSSRFSNDPNVEKTSQHHLRRNKNNKSSMSRSPLPSPGRMKHGSYDRHHTRNHFKVCYSVLLQNSEPDRI